MRGNNCRVVIGCPLSCPTGCGGIYDRRVTATIRNYQIAIVCRENQVAFQKIRDVVCKLENGCVRQWKGCAFVVQGVPVLPPSCSCCETEQHFSDLLHFVKEIGCRDPPC